MTDVLRRDKQWTIFSLILIVMLIAFVIYSFASLLGRMGAVEGWATP